MAPRKVPGDVRVRRARPADLPALLALEQRSFATDRLSPRQFRHHLSGRGNSLLLVATADAGVCGNSLLLFRAGSRRTRLYSIVVAADARGRGVGERLLARVEREARAHGATELALEVRHDNTAAITLYERRGYQRVGNKPGYYEDGAPAWRYLKTLQPAS